MSTTLTAPPAHAAAAKPVLLDAWYTRCPTLTAFSVAIQLGWLKEEFAHDKDVLFRALQTSDDPKVHQSHYAHTQPNSFRHGGSYPAIWAQSNGSNTRVIGLSWTPAPLRILSLPDSGIRTAADLKGKRLYLVRRPKGDIDFISATSLRVYEAALKSVGLGLGDVKIVERRIDRTLVSDRIQHGSPGYVTFNKNPSAGRGSENVWGLLQGEADAIVGPESLIEALGLHSVFNTLSLPEEEQFNNATPQTFAVNAELIEQHPDFVARVYARALQAVEWVRNNPEDALRIVAREQARTEVQTEEIFGDHLNEVFQVGLEPQHVAGLRKVKDHALKHGFLERDIDIDAWIDPRPLQAAQALVAERRKTPAYQAQIAPRPPLFRK